MFSSGGGQHSVEKLPRMSPPSRSESSFLRHGLSQRPRRGSNASSIHSSTGSIGGSIGGVLDTAPSGWSDAVLESGQNAISTLLQPPIVRTGLQAHTSAPASSIHKPPTARDIPPVPLTNIRQVDVSEFKPYLSQVGALYEQLQRVKDSEDEGQNQKGAKPDELLDPQDDTRYRNRPQASRKSSISSVTSLTSIDSSAHTKRRSSGHHRRVAHGPPPLTTIPSVYFEDDFHLENPRTFDVVSERSEVVPPSDPADLDGTSGNGVAPAPRKALATNAILQEKLSWYMDTIEVHLINSISTASTTFFTALGSLRELHSEAAESVERIKILRKDLAKLDEEVVSRGLELGQKRRKRENLQKLSDSIVQLKYVVEGVGRCEELVDQGDVEESLAEMDRLERVMAGERIATEGHSPLDEIQLIDIRGATALRGVNEDLGTLRFRIGRVYELKLQELLIGDLRKHVESVSTSEILQRWGTVAMRARGGHVKEPSVFPSYMADTKELRAALLPNIVGLHRANHIANAIGAYREMVLREIRSVVRRPLPSANDDDNDSMMSASTMSGGRSRSSQEKSAILARNLRALDPEDGEELLAKIYVAVSETLRRLTTQTKVLLDIGSEVGDPHGATGVKSPSVRSPIEVTSPGWRQDPSAFEIQEELHKALDLGNLLSQAVDTAQDKIVRILRVRSAQSVNLELVPFLRYFTLNLFFANECESISGRGGASLKTLVNSQIKDFVKMHGDREIQTLAEGMGSDNWNAKDFGDKENAILQDILQASTRDPDSWGKPSTIWVRASLDEQANGGVPPSVDSNGVAKEKARGATIDSETYLLPNSAILCLEGISHFLRLMGGIPSMTSDTASSLIAYLQMFNSRCTQLILGAGATRSAGLKNITTKHLALASQALAFLAMLIPHIREFVRRHAGSGPSAASLMGEFDKVRRLLQEHQDSIFQKLVDIMSSRAIAHCKTMRAVDWGVAVEGPHGFAETLSKETATLHRVLTKHLPERSIQLIMVPVFTSYKEHLGKAFQGADPKTEAGRERMLYDIEHLSTRLGKVEGFGDLGEYLAKIVKGKTVEPPPAPAPAPAPAPTTPPASQGDTGEGNKAEVGAEQGVDEGAEKKSEEKSEEESEQKSEQKLGENLGEKTSGEGEEAGEKTSEDK